MGTRGKSFKIINCRCHCDLRNYMFLQLSYKSVK